MPFDVDAYHAGPEQLPVDGARVFATGATRDLDADKLDFEGFLSPLVIEAYGKYMHEKRKMPNGTMRASDNWQLGIPQDAYMKSMFRHFVDVWKNHRGIGTTDRKTELLALIFNAMGYLHEELKKPVIQVKMRTGEVPFPRHTNPSEKEYDAG